MTIYRRFDSKLPITEDVRSEVQPFRRTKNTQRTGTTEPLKKEPHVEAYNHLRKAAPANIALPRTLMWCECLPPRIRPVALMRHFARIANVIAAAWDDLDQYETYMESLLTDKRGGRKGFPSEVLAELAALDGYRHTLGQRASPWHGAMK